MRFHMGDSDFHRMEDFSMMIGTNWEEAIRIKNEMLCEKDAEIKRLCAEVARLRQELGYIAFAKRESFKDDREFRIWTQNRASHALHLKPGELTIKKT
jgi:hypothetical protein